MIDIFPVRRITVRLEDMRGFSAFGGVGALFSKGSELDMDK